ncbi:MAG: VIT1/CCC1 transporter family protein [Planctomycetota bacterium]|nr:VIT1/CCC1 transporter family protein [Planctomycetota bacterium]
MQDTALKKTAHRVLEPIDRISEVLFGLVMVLGFTGSISAADAGRSDVRTMLFGAIGCNLAWGLIDGIMYLMACLSERGTNLRAMRAVRRAPDVAAARATVLDVLPAFIASSISMEEVDRLCAKARSLPEPPRRPGLRAADLRGAITVFCLCFVSTFPVVIPFLLTDDVRLAHRISNLVAVVLLFITGYWFGRCANLRPWLTATAMVFVGLFMVGATMVLGG